MMKSTAIREQQHTNGYSIDNDKVIRGHSDPTENLSSPEKQIALVGENIICFAKDWEEAPTSNNHVMRVLAENNRVLWLNSISTRTPNLKSGRDIGKIARKLVSFLRGPRQINSNLWVYTPIVLPFPHNRLAIALNRWIMRFTIGILRRKLKMREFQLWTFLPNVGDYVGKLGESVAVYYCVDEWSGFSNLDGAKIATAEQLLCQRADIVFTVSKSLYDRKRLFNQKTYLSTHGVDHTLFSRALLESTPIPSDLAPLPQPVIGFYGTVQDWVDLKLIAYLAERHPEWTIVLLGKVFVDTSLISQLPNVHFLGFKSYEELPAYCKGFAVGMIPYFINERLLTVNPLKLREYLCAGLPVVSTAVPEVSNYKDQCIIASSYEEFEKGVEAALRDDSPELRRRRSDGMRSETWTEKVTEVGARVMRVKAKRCHKQ